MNSSPIIYLSIRRRKKEGESVQRNGGGAKGLATTLRREMRGKTPLGGPRRSAAMQATFDPKHLHIGLPHTPEKTTPSNRSGTARRTRRAEKGRRTQHAVASVWP